MWGRFSNLASMVTGQDDGDDEEKASAASVSSEVDKVSDPSDVQIQMMEQERLILQLKEMIRERDKTVAEKETQLKKVAAEFSKHRLQSKSKIASLTSRLDESPKTAVESLETASVCSDESTSTLASEASSVVLEQTSRARMLVLKKRLKEKDQKLAEKDAIIHQKQLELEAKERVLGENERAAKDVSVQLTEQTNLVEHLRAIIRETTDGANSAELTTKKQLESQLEEMISQMVHKDNKIMDLMNQLTDKDKAIMDLQEHISEKDEVIRGRDQAIVLLKSLQSQNISDGQNTEETSQKLICELTEKISSGEQEIRILKQELEKKQTEVIEGGRHVESIDEIVKTLEKKLIDADNLLSLKSKESDQLKIEVVKREGAMLDVTEQLNITLKELEKLKEMEQHWSLERSRLLQSQKHSDEEIERDQLSESFKQLETSYKLLSEEHLKLTKSHDSIVEELAKVHQDREMESRKAQEMSALHEKEMEELQSKLEQVSGTTPDSKFAKFKALAGSKIKALEKQVEELKQQSDLTDQVASFRNHVAELEEEKGNLQLQILELEETVAKQGSERLKQELEEFQSRYNDLEAISNSQEIMIAQMKVTIDELKRNEAEHSLSAAKVKEEMEALVSELKLEIEMSRSLMDSKQNECSDLMSKLQELDREKVDLAKSLQINQELSLHNTALGDSLAEANKQIEELNVLVTKLKAENSSTIDLLRAEEEKVATQIQHLNENSVEIQQLNRSLQSMQKIMAEYEEKEKEFTARADMLQAKDVEIQSLREAVQGAEEQISKYKAKEEEYFTEADNLRSKESEIQILNDTVQVLMNKLTNFESNEKEFIRQSEISHEMENEIMQFSQRMADMAEKLQVYERRIEEMIEAEKQLQADNESLKTAILQKDENIQLVTTELNSSVNEIQEIKARAAVEIQNQDEMQMQLKKLQEDFEERGRLLSGLEATLLERESEVSRTVINLKNSEESLEKLKEENKTYRFEIDQKILDIQRLMAELEETQMFQKQTTEKVGILEKTLLEKDEEVHKACSDGEILQTEIESLTSRLRKSEDQVHILEKKMTDGERKIESLTQNLEEEELQLVSVTEELERIKACLAEGQLNEEMFQKQLLHKDEEMKILSDVLQEKETQSKKYLALIKKLKQKQQSDVTLQRQNDSFSSELQLCKDELDEKNVEIAKMQRSQEEFQLILNDRTEELERLRPIADELREMTVRCSDLTEEVRIAKLEKENLNKDLTEAKVSLGQKEMLLSNIQSELDVGCDEDIQGRILLIVEQEHIQRSTVSDLKRQIEIKETEIINISHHREELSKRILDLEREISMKNKELQVLGSSREDLSFQLGHSEQEKLYLTEELSNSQVLLRNKDSLIGKLNSELEHLQSDASENRSHENLLAEVESLKQQNLLLSETLAKSKEENLGLTSSTEQLNMEIFNLVNKLDASSEELSKLREEVKSNAVNSDEIDSMRFCLSEVENQNEQLSQKLQTLNSERETVINEKLLLTNALEQLKVEADQKKNHIADQDVELDALSNRLQMLTSENNELKKDLEEALSSVSDFKLEQNRTMLDKRHLESSVTQLNTDVQKLMEENFQLKLSCDNLSSKLEEVEMEKSEVLSQLSRLTAQSLESEDLIKKKESQEGVIRELQFEVESLRRSSEANSASKEDLTLLEKLKLRCSELEKKCDEICCQRDASTAENEALTERLNKINEKHQLTESQAREFELKFLACRKECDELQCKLEEEKARLEAETVKVRERAVKAEAAVQQLLTSTEIVKQRFAKVESELQGTAEELELLVARLTQKIEILEERNQKQLTDGQLKINELLLQLETCQEENRQVGLMMKSEKDAWKEKEVSFISDLDQLRLERLELEKEMQRKSSESTEQYNMLADDIRHYQDLIDQLKAKNFTLEESVSHLKENKAMEMENQLLRKQLEELNELRLENSSLTEQIERLKCEVQGLTETHDEVDDVMSRLFTSLSENEALQKKLNEQKTQVEEHSKMQSELMELNDKYDKALQNNNALIHQIEEMYTMIKVYKDGEAENTLLKERHQKLQNEFSAITESQSRLRQELQVYETDNKSLREMMEHQEKEISKASQVREERLVTKVSTLNFERLPQSIISDDVDDETPRIHASASNSDIRKLLNERDLECRQLNSKVDELTSQRDQLISHLQQREHELTNVHQQFQLLYQQYAILQQHYAAMAAEQQTNDVASSTARSSEQSVSTRPPSQFGDKDLSNNAADVLSKRLEDSEKLCKELAEETNRLEQQLELEKEKSRCLEDSIGHMQEQMKLHELSTQDSHTITMVEPEEERKIFRSKLSTALGVSRNQCPDVQRWFDGCSILLGRVLRGQPQVRKAIMLYIIALHVYIIFGCLLSML